MNIIEMARDSGLVLTCDMQDAYIRDGRYGKQLERFATLVRAAALEEAAESVWPTQQVKVWSDDELTAMTQAFNRAQEKHGWYETIMAVGATALKGRAAAIRQLKETK